MQSHSHPNSQWWSSWWVVACTIHQLLGILNYHSTLPSLPRALSSAWLFFALASSSRGQLTGPWFEPAELRVFCGAVLVPFSRP